MFTLFGTGILFPTAVTGAMNPMGHLAGTAGAVLGGLQNMGAAIMTLGFAHMQQTSTRPLAFVFDFATLSIAVLLFWFDCLVAKCRLRMLPSLVPLPSTPALG